MKKLTLLFFLTLITAILSSAQAGQFVDLTQSQWEYRWGDSPFENGIPVWSESNADADNNVWHTITYPSNPPDRNGQTNIWYRVKLPEQLTRDPHFYVFSIDIIPEVYFKGKRIYHFGNLDSNGQGKYAGWPWHMFELPTQSAGEYLYFRIYSNYIDIGMFGEILVGSRGDIIERFLADDIPKLMIGAASVFVAIIFLLSFLSRIKKVQLFILGSLFLDQGMNVLSSVKITQLFYMHPLLNQFISASAFYYFPVGMALYLDLTVKNRIPFNPIRRIWQFHLMYLIGAISGALLGLFQIPATYEHFDIIYYYFTLPTITVFLIYYFIKGDTQTKLTTASFLIVCAYQVLSHLISEQIFPWVESPRDVAVFLCLLLLSYSIVKNFNYTQELEEEKQELTELTSIDYLTQLYNRKEIDALLQKSEQFAVQHQSTFSIIIIDIDDFKQVNDTYGHLVGDQFLIELGNLLTNHTRDSDKVGRWGGEEFLIICSETDQRNALLIAEKLRHTIAGHWFSSIGNKTISLGVATYQYGDSTKTLLERADEALYRSKGEGKNRVSFA